MPKQLIAIVNPKRRRRKKATSKKRTRRSRRNPDLMTIAGLVNPRKRRKGRYSFSSKKWTYRKRRAHRNPSGFAIGLDSIGFTALGAVGSKLVPTFVPWVKDRNKGLIAYAAQAATGGLLYVILAMLFKQKKAGQYVLLGTAVSLVTTALDDFWFKRKAATVKGLGFYPDQQLTAYDYELAALGQDYEVVEGLAEGDGDESFLIGQNYEETPLDQIAGLGVQRAITKARVPLNRVQALLPGRAAIATQPLIIRGSRRWDSRW